MEGVSIEERRRLLAPYVTSLDAPVFALKNLPEEVVAVLFAYYSRSRDDLRSNLLRLLKDEELALSPSAAEDAETELALAREKAREFHEKWVVGYGHASVAEHAVAHVAVEDVSILAGKVIEDARLASYTEKSTRYIPFTRAYYSAPELPIEAGSAYRQAVERLFDAYESLLPRLTHAVMECTDKAAFKTERGFENACRAQACDASRYLLPAATHTNLGLTANARTLEHLISKMLSHPLVEARETGELIRVESTRLIPTLIKYARRSEYRAGTPPAMETLAAELLERTPQRPEQPDVRLVSAPAEAEDRLCAAILYEYANAPFESVMQAVRSWPEAQRRRVIEEYLSRRVTHGDPAHGYTDPPLRSLEHLYFTFEIVVDYGAYRDIQRHRIAMQTTPRLTADLGFDVPNLVESSGLLSEFSSTMDMAASAWRALASTHAEEAQYVVPLAFRKRVLITWNLRELHHFVSLRSARQGHDSYRRVAQAVYRELERRFPFLAKFVRVDLGEYPLSRPG